MFEGSIGFIESIDGLVSLTPTIYVSNEKTTKPITVAYFIQEISGYLFKLGTNEIDSLPIRKLQLDNFSSMNTQLIKI